MEAGDFGKRIQPRDFLHPGPSGCIPNLREPAKIRLRKQRAVHCQWRERASLAVNGDISCKDTFFFFIPLPDTLWAPRWIQGDTARDTGSAGDETALPAGGDNSSLLELWQFLLVLNPQELSEVITFPSQSIYSCCLPLFILHTQHAPDPLLNAVSRTCINFTVSSASQFSSPLKVLNHPYLYLETKPLRTLPEWLGTQEDRGDPILCQ